jgi:hypothetical protein
MKTSDQKVRLVYIVGPYRAETRWEEEQNVRRAEEVAYGVAQAGAYPVCPHSATRPYFADAQPGAFWIAATLEMMRRCDAVCMVAGWKKSDGARVERAEAERLGLPVFERWSALREWLG